MTVSHMFQSPGRSENVKIQKNFIYNGKKEPANFQFKPLFQATKQEFNNS